MLIMRYSILVILTLIIGGCNAQKEIKVELGNSNYMYMDSLIYLGNYVLKDSLPDASYVVLDNKGKVLQQCSFVNNKKQGDFYRKIDNFSFEISMYNKGKLDGQFISYSISMEESDTTYFTIGEYNKGEKVGNWIEFYPETTYIFYHGLKKKIISDPIRKGGQY